MGHTLKKQRKLILLILLGVVSLIGVNRTLATSDRLVTSFDPSVCNTIISSPAESIQSAINNVVSDHTICVREGIYHEAIMIDATKTNIRLIAYDNETPVIDGNKRLPGGLPAFQYIALVELNGNGSVFDGFDVRYSSGRGIDVTGNYITVRNSRIHDNWDTGIIMNGDGLRTGVLIENNQVFNNLRRVKNIPVVYRGERSGSGPTDWTFDPDITWDEPFWTGAEADLPEAALYNISLTFNDDGRTSRIYVGSSRAASRTGIIGAEYSVTGQPLNYYGNDILFHLPDVNLWSPFFTGSLLGLPSAAIIDAFQIESIAPETWPCTACAPILMSFTRPTVIPITDQGVVTPTSINPSDLVRFSPTAIGGYGEILSGTYSLYRRASELGLPGGVDIDALDRLPDGRLVISLDGAATITSIPVAEEDLIAYDETTASWSLYFDGDQIPFNPFHDELTAAWLDRSGHIYISGNPVGGSALSFIKTVDSVARNNAVFNNYGEGLVAGRFSQRITLENNVAYDNFHANLYLNSTIGTRVEGNFVYCTNDMSFWRKGTTDSYSSPPGIILRDEDFPNLPEEPPVSSGLVIINNIVAGCSDNLAIATQKPGGGLNNSLVANNTFVNARGETALNVTNISIAADASLVGSYFVNNLIVQNTPGTMLVNASRRPNYAQLTVANNLYSSVPPWFPDEPGRVVSDPFMVMASPLPTVGTIVSADDYKITFDSPALDAGQLLSELTRDYFGSSRAGSGLPDIGAHELSQTGQIIIRQVVNPPESTQTINYLADFAPLPFTLAHGEEYPSPALQAGTYSVTAEPIDGWDIDAVCDDGSAADAIILGVNETVTCTFSAERQTRLVINHVIEPPSDTALFDFSLTPGVTFQMGSGIQTFVVTPGVAYAVAATVPDGWQQAASCDNDDNPEAVTLDPGDLVICTFTHTYSAFESALTPEPTELVAPGGEVTFAVVIDNVGVAAQLTGLIDSVFGDITDTANPNLASTTCVLPHSLLAGDSYECAYVAQVNGSAGGSHTSMLTASGTGAGGVGINATAEAVVSFVPPPPGRIIVTKVTVPAGAAGSFNFNTSYDVDGFSLGHGQSNDSGLLPSGVIYSVGEIVPTGWSLTAATCAGDDDGVDPTNIVLDPNETVTCTFTNTRLGLSLTNTPAPGNVITPGGDVVFNVQVTNTGSAAAELTSLTDSVFGNVTDAGNTALVSTTCNLPQNLSPGAGYSCAYTAHVAGAGNTSHESTLAAVATGPGGEPISASTGATVTIQNPASGRIIIVKQTNPPNMPGSFAFTSSYDSDGFSLSHGQRNDSGPLLSGAVYSVSENTMPGWQLTGATCDDGSLPNAISLSAGETVTCSFVNVPISNGETAVIYITPLKAGSVRGLAYAPGDILAYDTHSLTWSLHFDASDVGLTKPLSDFVLLGDDSILLTYSGPVSLRNAAGGLFSLAVQDVARFIPYTLGQTTSGAFELYFDGSDVALSTSGEKIDALALKADGTLLISTTGAAAVKNGGQTIKAVDEDILAFAPRTLGANTAGTWSLALDGSRLPGMGVEDVTAIWHDDETGDLYLAVMNNFAIAGVSGTNRIVLRVTPGFAVSAYWNAANTDFSGAIDGLHIRE